MIPGKKLRSKSVRRILAGVCIGSVCGLGVVLLGFRLTRSHPPVPRPVAVPVFALPLADVTVILDPGHGGEDPGADHGPLSEAMLTYRMATEVAASLRPLGATVIYTVRSQALAPELSETEPPLVSPVDARLASTGRPLRTRRSPEPLWERAATARRVWNTQKRRDPEARWDVFFLSLHFDQSPAPSVTGGVVCVDRRVRRIPDLAIALARALVVGNFGRGCDYRGIRGISGHTLGVLDPAHNPVPEKVLLEVATLSNSQDQLEAADPLWRNEIARRITDAILEVHRTRNHGL